MNSNTSNFDPSNFASQFIGNYATSRVNDFLKPKSALDKLYAVCLIFWFAFSVIFLQLPYLRVISFSAVILLLIVANVENWIQGGEVSLASSTVKLFICYCLIEFFIGTKQRIEPFPDLQLPYNQIEGSLLLIIIIITIFTGYLHISILKYRFVGYLAFLSGGLRGIWYASLAALIFYALNALKVNYGTFTLPIPEFVLVGLCCYFLAALLCYSLDPITQNIIKRSPIAGIRDAAIASSLSLFILTFLYGFLNSGATILTGYYWDSLLPLLLIVGVVLLIFFRNDMQTNGLGHLFNNASQRVEKLSKYIDNLDFKEPEKVFVANNPLELLKKQNTRVTANKNAVLIPVGDETAENVPVVVMGESDIAINNKIDGKTVHKAENATLLIPQKEWQAIKEKLAVKNVSDTSLATINPNIFSKDALISTAHDSLNQYKLWTKEKGLASIQNKLTNLQQIGTKYGVESSKGKTKVNLPGITVLEENGQELVKVGPINVLEIQTPHGTFTDVKIGKFMSVMALEPKGSSAGDGEYTLVKSSFVSVLDTPEGSIVNFLGMQIVDGEKDKILASIPKMMELQAKMSDYYRLRMSNLFTDNQLPEFVFAQSPNGQPLFLMSGEHDQVLVDDPTKLLPPPSPSSKTLPKDRLLEEGLKAQEEGLKAQEEGLKAQERGRKAVIKGPADESVIELSEEEFEIIKPCIVCQKDLDGRTILCPNCNEEFHRSCFREYVKINHKCPSCQKNIRVKE